MNSLVLKERHVSLVPHMTLIRPINGAMTLNFRYFQNILPSGMWPKKAANTQPKSATITLPLSAPESKHLDAMYSVTPILMGFILVQECHTQSWSPWTSCSATCGKGFSMRKRSYVMPLEKTTAAGCNRRLVHKKMCAANVPCQGETAHNSPINDECRTW